MQQVTGQWMHFEAILLARLFQPGRDIACIARNTSACCLFAFFFSFPSGQQLVPNEGYQGVQSARALILEAALVDRKPGALTLLGPTARKARFFAQGRS